MPVVVQAPTMCQPQQCASPNNVQVPAMCKPQQFASCDHARVATMRTALASCRGLGLNPSGSGFEFEGTLSNQVQGFWQLCRGQA
eukprot:359428-Chlamydomonas_euryale.AAC.1